MNSLVQKLLQAKIAQKQLLNQSQFDTEMLKIRLNLLDLNAALRSLIASQTAVRSSTASRLQATTQSTLDNLHNSLMSLRSDLPASKESLWPAASAQLQRIDGEMGVRWGEFRTRMEGVKLRSIYAFTMGIAAIFLAVVVERTRSRKVVGKDAVTAAIIKE